MKIAIVVNAFKGTLTAAQAARCIADGLRRASRRFTVDRIPMADGGAGTVDTVVRACGGNFRHARVSNPLGEKIRARYGLVDAGRTAIIEMAAASGISLLKPYQRNPLKTTTYGTGEFMLAALRTGAKKIIVGVGDSATNDGGAGMAEALGAKLLDGRGRPIPRGAAGLAQLRRIDIPASSAISEIKAKRIQMLVCCDVDNPLVGKNGAAYTYGAQKFGVRPPASTVKNLDANLRHFAAIVKRDLGISVANMKHAGAAGGLGAGLHAFLGAKFRKGFDLVAEMTGLRKRLKGCDLVITGEGKLDSQTAWGKMPSGVARLAGSLGIPVIALGGAADKDADQLLKCGIAAYFVCRPPADINDIRADADLRLTDCAEQLGRLISLK